ncbi:hypothetical protein OG216_45835 (plasmid) [Streptomycetaceae bacterium NBC_01309]
MLTDADLQKLGPAHSKPKDLEGWDSACSWMSWQFMAGYTPPPPPDDSDLGGDPAKISAAITEGARRVRDITDNSTWINVTVAVRSGPPRPLPSSYTESGHRFELSPPTQDRPDNCTAATAWGGGTLAVVVTDATRATPPCDSAKRLIALLAKRGPQPT